MADAAEKSGVVGTNNKPQPQATSSLGVSRSSVAAYRRPSIVDVLMKGPTGNVTHLDPREYFFTIVDVASMEK